ncbi:MAG: helicase-related protein [Proteobacteria bacterium]|nr:helicase-related protein [Pseudomonadota bacterium]
MSLINEKRVKITEQLRTVFLEHGRKIAVEHVPFFNSLSPDDQESVKKILKKFRSGSHTPDSLLAEYNKWSDAPPPVALPTKSKVSKAKLSQGFVVKPKKSEAVHGRKETSPKFSSSRDENSKESEKKQKKAAQKRQKNALELALISALRENREFSDYKNVFIAARAKKRKFIAYLGPTNSGKTHAAMEALREAHSGVYLGPLRLMALENYDRLREKEVSAGLLTGEERLELDTATHVCQTIETANFNQTYDVAVIDEIQLLTDKDRGGYWLNAVMGIAADVVYLCGAPIIENVLRDLAELTGDELEIRYTERKSPLVFSDIREDPKKLPAPGTAFIAFSRKNVLLWKDLLESAGGKVSVVYGALSPEVRKEQSRRFRDGETDYLVATDAVGMGLNLPIQKILFTEIEKFDGQGFRSLLPQEVKQIGGRAGRFGIAMEAGVITSYVAKDLSFLRQRYGAEEKELGLSDVHMKPTAAHVRKICESFNDHSLEFALRKFQKIGHEIFSVDISEEELITAEKLDRIFGTDPSSISTRWFFGIAPADPKNEETFSFFLELAVQYKKVLAQEKLSVDLTTYQDEKARLEFAESQRKNLTLYLWFANKKPDVFQDKDKAHDMAVFYDDLINKLLSHGSKAKKKNASAGLTLSFCKECKAMMPPFSQYDVCRECYQNRRW